MTGHDDSVPPTGLDLEILARDIQAINGADAVTAFGARLGLQHELRRNPGKV